MSLRKLHKEKVCAKETIVLSLWRNLRNTWLAPDSFSPCHSFMKLKQNKTTQKCTNSVIQSKMMHTSKRIPACTSATGRASLPAQQGGDYPFNICLLLRSRGICLAHRAGRWGGRWSTFPQELEAGTVESALQSSRLSSQGTCTSFLFCSIPSKPIQSYLVSLCLCKGSFCPKNNTPLPHSLACIQWCKKPEQRKMTGQQKTLLHFTIKRNNAALIFLESFIVWNIACSVWLQFLFFLITIQFSFPPTEVFNRT